MLITSATFFELVKKAISVVETYDNFPIWFIDRLRLLPRKKIVYKLRNGLLFTCESHTYDCQFIGEMFIDKQYTCFPGFEISKTDTIVDCGAHKGMFTVFAARQASQGKVISYEASPETYQYLVDNLRINQIENVTHFDLAVGLIDGTAKFCVASDPGCSMVIFGKDENISSETVPVAIIEVPQISFQNVLDNLPQVDLLKMDIEGVEFSVLMNCSAVSLQKVKRIALEYHPEAGDVEALTDHLNANGFQTHLWQKRRLCYAWRES